MWWSLTISAAGGFTATAHDWFSNTYAAELASNGPYQFFAAFRASEIDYQRFYATLPLAQVDQRLRAELQEPAATFLSSKPLDLRRHIDNPGVPQRLNIVLIMVESLSGEFLARFGGPPGLTPYLNQLAEQSLSFDNFYATGTRTDRGLEAVTRRRLDARSSSALAARLV